MSGAKFRVGEHVAVCTKTLILVIPKTVVEEVRFLAKGMHLHSGTVCLGIVRKDFYAYLVQGSEAWLPEECLRPIDPDEEYQEEETDEDVTV